MIFHQNIKPETKDAIEKIDLIYKSHGQELVVTSGTEGHPGDGVHKHDSLHYSGYAFDCRIWYFKTGTTAENNQKVNAVAKAIREELGKDYDVLVEEDHIHVEYDPKEGVDSVIKKTKRALDILGKFIADMTPFFRMIQKWWKSRK